MSYLSKIVSPGNFGRKNFSDASTGGGTSIFSWGMSSLAGEAVSPSSASQVAAVFCACKILYETMGMISLDMYEQDGQSIRKLPKHPLQFRLHSEPNEEQTAMEWREQMTASLALWGNAYSRKVMRGSRLAALQFLAPQAMNPRRDDRGKIVYRYLPLDGRMTLDDIPAANVLHIKLASLGGDGLEGTSPVIQVRNAIGLAMALERYGSRFFANGAIPGGVLMYPGNVNDEMNRNIRESWKKLYGGADNAHEIAVLEEGLKYQQVGIDPEKSQSLESRKFQILEVARVWRIPPHMLYEGTQDSASSVEQDAIGFVRWTLMPWVIRWQQALDRSLLAEEEKGKVFCGFHLEDLEYGDLASRSQAHAMRRQWGAESANDWRRAEGMNPREDPEGDAYLSPLNMVSYNPDGSIQNPQAAPKPGASPSVPGSPSVTGSPTIPPKKSRDLRDLGASPVLLWEAAQDIASTARRLSKGIQREIEEAA